MKRLVPVPILIAVLLSACGTFGRGDVAATVNGKDITVTQVNELVVALTTAGDANAQSSGTATPTTIAAGGHPASRPGLAPQSPVPAGAAVPTRRQPPGGVDPAKTQLVVRSHLSEIQRCYERGKMDDPDLRGRVTVRIAISANGAVSDAGIDGSTLGNGGVEGCMTSAVRSWKFPAPTAGGAVISYPFNLR